jgi:PAS domain-containing protein/DNA-binding CsgD family transcriptional regulator
VIDAQLRDVLHRSALPLALVDLDTLLIVDANDAARALLGEHGDVQLPLALHDVLLPEDEARVVSALQLVRDGTIHSYDASRRLRRSDGATVRAHIWVRALPSPSNDFALAVFLPDDGAEGASDNNVAALPAPPLALKEPIVIGSIDASTRITQMSADAKALLGETPNAYIGQELVGLVHPDDIGTLLTAVGRALSASEGVGVRLRVRVRVRGSDVTYVPLHMIVTPTEPSDEARLGFVLNRVGTSDATPSNDRVAELEQHLWRIAAEVQAAGVVDNLHRLPDNRELPELAQLSSRQWNVLSGLMRGERVPDIARAMHVSQSTVRNHLAKIFRALGVHSQAELLARLRERNQRNV